MNRRLWILVPGLAFAMSACGDDGLPAGGSELLKPPVTTGVILGTLELEGLGACAGVAVDIDGPSGLQEIVTAGGGTFRVEGLSAGAYAVRARAEGYTAIEEVFVYDAVEPRDVGTVALAIERVPVRGRVKTSDGASTAGAAVAVSAEANMAPPAGISCDDGAGGASVLGGVTALVGPDGTWESELPAIADRLRGVVSREGYTEEPFEVAGEVLTAAAAAGEPADAGEVTLYPLTGFVNAVGGRYQNSLNVDLQVSAFNGAGELRLGSEVDGICDYTGADWVAFDATPTFTATADGEITICVGVRNDRGQEIEFTTDVVVDTTAPSDPSLAIRGGAFTTSPSLTLDLSAVGADEVAIQETSDFSSATWLGYGSPKSYVLTGGDGPRTIYARFRDRAGNLSAVVSATVTLDTVAPTAGGTPIVVSGGASGTSVRTVTLTIDAGDADEMQVSESASFAGASWEAAASSRAFELTAGDGVKTVYVRFRDTAGNTTGSYNDTISLDTTPPTGATLAIVGNPSAVSSTTVSLTLGATGAATIELANNSAFTGAATIAYTTSASHTLTAGDGLKTVYARYCDDAGNCSAAASVSVVLDTVAPSGGLLINNGAASTTNRSATLTISASDTGSGIAGMRLQNDTATGIGATSLLAFEPSRAWTLSGAGAETATKTVYLQLVDAAGNTSTVASDSIALDNEGPTLTSVTIAAGASITSTRSVSVTLSATGADEMLVSQDAAFAGATWRSYASTFDWNLEGADGTKTLYVRLKDSAGNFSSTSGDTIDLDTTPPTLSAVVIDGGAAWSQDLNVSVASTTSGSPTTMRISEGATVLYTGAFAATTSVTLAAGEGARTLTVRVWDAVGLASDSVFDSISVDTEAPSGLAASVQEGSFTTSPNVTVLLSASGADQVAIQESADFSGATWGAYATQKAFVLSGGDGLKTIYVQVRDAAGWTNGPVSVDVTLDESGPTPGATPIVINGGDAGTSVRTVTLTIDAGDADEMQVSESASFAGASWEAAASSRAFELSPGDGVKTVYVRFRDNAGNTTGSYNDTISLDTTPPTGATLAIVGNPSAVSSTTVSLALGATGASTVELANNLAFTGASTFAYTTATSTTLSSGDGVKNVYARFCDDAANCTAGVGVSVVLDQTAPVGAIAINGGAASTTSRSATLTLSASDAGSGIAGMRLQNDTATGIGATSLLAFEPSRAWTLSGAGAETATKTVHYVLVDAAGNTSTVYADSIALDNEAPTLSAVTVNGGTTPTNNRTLAVALTTSGSPTEMRVSEDAAFAGATWTSFAASFSHTFTSGDGAKTLYVQVRDESGNTSSTQSGTVTIDTTGPSLTVAQINGGAAYASSLDVTVTTTAGGTPSRLVITEGASTLFDGAYSASETLTLAAGEGPRTLGIRVYDALDNASDLRTASIVVDTAKPTGAVLIAAGADRVAGESVTLNLAANDGGSGVKQLYLADSQAGLATTTATSYDQTKAWTLAAVAGGSAASRTVWMQVEDNAGNRSTAVSDSITVDKELPTGSISLSAAVTNDTLIGVDLTFAGDTAGMKLSSGNACAGGNWVGVADATLWSLAAVDGTQHVSVRFRDAVGNESACYSDSVDLDRTGPSPTSLTLAGSGTPQPGYSDSADVTATFATAAADCATAEFSEDVGFLVVTDTHAVCSDSLPYTFAAASDGTKNLYLRYVDTLGNVGPLASATIVVDSADPQVGVGGAFTIAEGEYVGDAAITLQMNAVGATRMRVAQDTVCSGGLEVYSATRPLTLTGGDGPKTVAVRFEDEAGNASLCYTQAVTLDTAIGGFTVSLEGVESRSDLTANPLVDLNLTGVAADAMEMMVSNNPTFGDAAWVPVSTGFSWTLAAGDGLRSVHVRVRDRAGNVATAFGSIILDMTAPDVPDLQVVDIDGDGFALSSDDVELQWSSSAGADVFELAREIRGVDAGFTVVQTFASGQSTWRDSSLQPGYDHRYRIRASDEIGNVSPWSTVVVAQPFEPVTQVAWIAEDRQFRYDFPPNRGTFSLNPSHRFEDVGGNPFTAGLTPDLPSWLRPTPAADIFAEMLRIRTSNPMGSVVYDSDVPLLHNRRDILDDRDYTGEADIVMDAAGALHVVYYYSCRLEYMTNRSGVWVRTTIHGTSPCVGFYNALAVDGDGHLHVAYLDQTNDQLRYATNQSGAWVSEIVDDGGDGPGGVEVGLQPDIAVGSDGTVHISYRDQTNRNLLYASGNAGAWALEVLDTETTVGEHSSIALDSAGDVHITYYQSSSGGGLAYMTNASGVWNKTMIHAGGLTGTYTSLAIGADDVLHVAYRGYNSGYTLSYATNGSGGWVTTELRQMSGYSFGAYNAIAVDGSGNPHILHQEAIGKELHYATNVTGAWEHRVLDRSGDVGTYTALAVTPQGLVHGVYSDNANSDRLYLAYQLPGIVPWSEPVVLDSKSLTGAYGSLALDRQDRVHIAYREYDGGYGLSYLTNAGGVWATTKVDVGAGLLGNYASLALDAADQAHVSYADPTNARLKYATNAGGGWAVEVVDASASVGNYSDIAVDADGDAHIVYRDSTNNQLKYATNETGLWVPSVIDAAGGGSGYASIATGPSGEIHVSYYYSCRVRYAVLSGGVWTISVVDGTAPCVGFYNDLRVDASGHAHVAYLDQTNDVLRYATNRSGAWVPEVVDSTSASGEYPSLAVDAQSHVYISYWRNDSLRYATNLGGFWQTSTLDSDGRVGMHTSLAMDRQGRSHVSYFDEAYRLKYLTGTLQGVLPATRVERTEPFQ